MFDSLEVRFTKGLRDDLRHRKYFIKHFADLKIDFISIVKTLDSD